VAAFNHTGIKAKTPVFLTPDIFYVQLYWSCRVTVILADKTIAILAADGFNELHMTEIQRALVRAKASVKIVAPEPGIVNGWQDDNWGHHFHVDAPIAETLGSDFDMLVIPGGPRCAEKLKGNPHAKRIVKHFLEAEKPVAAIGEGVSTLALSDMVAEKTLAAPVELHAALIAANVMVSENELELDETILTAAGNDLPGWVEATLKFFAEVESVKKAA
jgi:protease I